MKAVALRKILLAFILTWFLMFSCDKPKENPYTSQVVSLEDYSPSFPEGPGYNEFRGSCITCHSLRYIEMQPNFPEKTWDALAKKMVKNFGAPIPDSTLAVVVKYLASVKGTE